jgi:hypothetical protein
VFVLKKGHARVVPNAAILLKKKKNLVFRPETLFFVYATSFLTTPEARGGGAIRPTPWSDSPQGVGQIAPVSVE